MIRPTRRAYIFCIVLWIVLLCAAFFVDRAVAQWVQRTRPLDKNDPATKVLIFIVRRPGNFWFLLIVAFALFLWHARKGVAAAALVLSGMGSGINALIKWTVGRHRPVIGIAPFEFHPFPQGLAGLFHTERALCFPSGDTTTAFAAAASLAILLPRWKWVFFSIAALVAVERVLENAHYVSDVIAGAGIGMLIGTAITQFILSHQDRVIRQSEA